MRPAFPKHITLGSDFRLWIRKDNAIAGYDSEDGKFEILRRGSAALLISNVHKKSNGTPWHKRFNTVKAAMEFAEQIDKG